ncbi:MAG: SpoIIE family protein phosphatase [Salinivirgaceae bacterium]|jgi:serine phosphatase RsbU (regulator of sigma subunit)|nr:SpoIIE family protein phosphatase [Salinivirgaceae bacterium]
MKFFKEHMCKSQAIFVEIKKSELKMENLINKYRVFLVTFLMFGDVVFAHFTGLYDHTYVRIGIPSMIFIYFGLFKLHKLTKSEKPKPYLKYITICIDYFFISFAIFEMKHILPEMVGIEVDQIALISAMLYMVINSFSALRIQKKVIAFSTLIGLILNTYIQLTLGSASIIVFYTNGFIIVTGVFNQYISKFIHDFYTTNFKLTEAMDDLSQANEEIKTQNEEINAQNDELATQNDYLAKQRDEITYQKQQITSSIQYASRIQNAVLSTPEEISIVAPDNFIVYEPKDIVSGDFYWFKEVNLGKKKYKVFTAVDCTGHGVPGGFMSMLGTSFLNEIVAEFKDELISAQILNRLREEVKKLLRQTSNNTEIKDGMDMALCAIDYDDMTLQFAGANSALYIIRNIDGKPAPEIEEIKPDKMPIGVYIKEGISFSNQVLDINKGDILYTFSDGIIDQFGGEKGEKFKKRRFKQLLLDIAHLSMDDQKKAIEQKLKKWMGNLEQIDDITVIGVRV